MENNLDTSSTKSEKAAIRKSRRAKSLNGRIASFKENTPCNFQHPQRRMSFDRNLITKPAGDYGYWYSDSNGQHFKEIESTPLEYANDLPNDPDFEGKKYCFPFSDNRCERDHRVHLSELGFSSKFIDMVRPSIEVSTWYAGGDNSIYIVDVHLLDESGKTVRVFKYHDTTIQRTEPRPSPNHGLLKWHKVSHVFENYEPGVRTILFIHNGDVNCRIAGVCAKVLTPKFLSV